MNASFLADKFTQALSYDRYVRTGTDDKGEILGHFQATGVRPRFLADLVARGINIPGNYFDPSKPL